MTSKHLDSSELDRRAGFDFDLPADSLKGRVILVPGGAGGLGAAMVALLARDELGSWLVTAPTPRGPRGWPTSSTPAQADRAGWRSFPPAGMARRPGRPSREGEREGRQRLLKAAEAAPGGFYGLWWCGGGRPPPASRAAPATAPAEGGVFEGSINYAAPKAALTHAARILAKPVGPTHSGQCRRSGGERSR